MRGRLRKLALVLAVAGVFLNFVVQGMCVASSQTSHAQVDVFTQKEPFSGRGPNMPSDAFGPQEIVVLYALVTTDNTTVENILVAFNIETPNDGRFSISGRTNASGITSVSFTIATPPINITETDVFGYWRVTATFLYAGTVLSDTLTFRVDWVVKLLTVRTIAENLTDLSAFGNGGDVGLEITLRSIAKTLRNATISIVVKDELDFTVNFSLIRDFAVQPNEKLLFIYSKASLPKGAHIGLAKVFVSAFTVLVSEGGVPFCPAIHAEFSITPADPLAIDLHDVAVVAVLPSANPLEVGQGLSLATLVRNEGTTIESFNVSTYFENVLLGTAMVVALPPYATMLFYYTIDPSMLTLGNHTISANIPPVPNEADLTDNDFSDIVEVVQRLPTGVHDIAVTLVTISSSSIFVGDVLRIDVTVFNMGNESETFDLGVFYNSSLIESIQVVSLASLTQETFIFYWNTRYMAPGFYEISASAPLPGDPSPADNTYVDGVVEIKSGVPPERIHDVAILNVVPWPTLVEQGDIVNINVTVKNKGSETESFYVTLYYDHVAIGKRYVGNLGPSLEVEMSFAWNTSGVFPMNYIISAVADRVEGETQLADNTFIDGTVTISPYPACFPNLDVLIFGAIVVVAVIAGLVLLFLVLALERIRRRRRRARPTYTVIVHPHI